MSKSESERGLMEFVNINRFKVSIDVQAGLSKDGATTGVHMMGDNFFRAVPDSNCVLQWTLTEPDVSKMQFDLKTATMHTADVTPVYSGTKKWKSAPANLRLDFCKEEKDTAFLFGFSPVDGKEVWTAQGAPIPAQVIPTTLLMCFVDVERAQANASDASLQARMEQEIQEKSEKLKAAIPANKDPSKMTPEELAKFNAAMNEAKDMMGDMQSISPYSFLFKTRLRNHEKTILDTTLNGKELFPQNTAISEAIFHLQIEHDEK
jgi:hypothetical protein